MPCPSASVPAEQASPLNSSMDSGPGGGANAGAAQASGDSQKNPGNPAGQGRGGNGQQRPAVPGQSDDDSGCALEEYTWEPPGLKPEQVRHRAGGAGVKCVYKLPLPSFVTSHTRACRDESKWAFSGNKF